MQAATEASLKRQDEVPGPCAPKNSEIYALHPAFCIAADTLGALHTTPWNLYTRALIENCKRKPLV